MHENTTKILTEMEQRVRSILYQQKMIVPKEVTPAA